MKEIDGRVMAKSKMKGIFLGAIPFRKMRGPTEGAKPSVGNEDAVSPPV